MTHAERANKIVDDWYIADNSSLRKAITQALKDLERELIEEVMPVIEFYADVVNGKRARELKAKLEKRLEMGK